MNLPLAAPASPAAAGRSAASRRWRSALLALAVLALAVRLAAIALTQGYVARHDDADYDRHACWVVEHGFLPERVPPGVGPESCAPRYFRGNGVTAYRPPLWPLVLGATYAAAGTHDRWTKGRVVQAVIGAAAAVLTGLIAAQVWGRAAGLVALGLAAVFLPLVLTGASLVSEPLFVALVLAAVLAALKARRSAVPVRWAAAAGVLTGLAGLTRANGPVVAVVLLFAVWTARPRLSLRALRAPAAFALAAILVTAPWTIRNAIVVHAFVPVSTSGGNTLLGTYNETARTRPGCEGCWTLLKRNPRWQPFLNSMRGLTEPQRDRRQRDEAFKEIRRHPTYVAAVLWHNSVRLLELQSAGRTEMGARTIDVPPRAALAGRWELWAVVLLGAAGLLLGTARRAPPFLVVLFALLWITTALIQSETPRFRAPLDPFLVMAAAAGAVAIARRAHR